jgi:DNA-binding NtrC family response regulator
LEDGEVRRIGEREGKKVDVRVLAATNVALSDQIKKGVFRQDLYFRLARYLVAVPPLRQRQEDIPLLAQHFLQLFAKEMGREVPELSAEVSEALKAYSFPGNVRELKNIVERALIESGGGELRAYHLHFLPEAVPVAMAAPASAAPELPWDLEEAEIWLIKRAIARTEGNLSEAARLLGTNRNRIYRALAQEEHHTPRGTAHERS